MTTTPLVSIVIPVLHDTAELASLLERLAPSRNPPADHSVVYQVVVVNGDPNDVSLHPLYQRFPEVEWVESAPGRGRQMNHGARLATGQWLLFLHADAYPERGWIEAIKQADQSSAIGGAFCFRLESTALNARVLERGVDLRTRLFGLPYGDQGVFVRRHVFDDEGGYAELPIMEDLELVRRLRRRGAVALVPGGRPGVGEALGARRLGAALCAQRLSCRTVLCRYLIRMVGASVLCSRPAGRDWRRGPRESAGARIPRAGAEDRGDHSGIG